MLTRCSDELLRFARIHGRWFLAEDMLAGAECRERNLHVRRRRCDDRDQLSLAVERFLPGMTAEELDIETGLAKIRGLGPFGPAASDDSDSSHAISSGGDAYNWQRLCEEKGYGKATRFDRSHSRSALT